MRRSILVLTAVLAGCGTDVSGPSTSLFSCVLSGATILSPGEALQVRGAGNQAMCVTANGDAAEYVYIPFFGREPPSSEEGMRLQVELEGAGVVPSEAEPPDPSVAATRAPFLRLGPTSGPRIRSNHAFHVGLREREAAELGRKLRRAGPAPELAPAYSVAPRSAVTAGDLLDLNVSGTCSREDVRTGRVEYVSDHAVVVADTANPAGLDPADFRHFGMTFDTLVHPVAVEHFGEPTDIDQNDRAILFFTRAVNELTAPGAEVYTAGFFWSGDLFPVSDTPQAEGCPTSNQGELFYLLTADPKGEIGIEFDVEFVRQRALGTIAHEYQHLINASRRLWVNDASRFEAVWLNEGLSHIAEELVFFAATGLEPGQDITIEMIRETDERVEAFNGYMAGNMGNFASFMAEPDTASLMGTNVLATRGAAWAFLRYAADRSGRSDASFFTDLVNGTSAGVDNLRSVLGEDPVEWMRDWTVAVYADNAIPSVADRYTLPSWNFRNLYPETSLGEFPLTIIPLESGERESLHLRPGGTAYTGFGVVPDGRAAVHVEASGDTPPASLRGTVLRIR